MKCNASPTTSNAVKPPNQPAPPGRTSEDQQQEEVQAFTTLLAQSALKPISETLGPVGDAVTDLVARQIGSDFSKSAEEK